LFFILAGVTFSPRGGFVSFTRRKLKTLILPYYVFSLYFIAKPLAVLLFPFLADALRTAHDYGDARTQLFDVVIMGNGLWFLMALFVGELVCFAVLNALGRLAAPAKISATALAGMTLIAGVYLSKDGVLPSPTLPFQLVPGIQAGGFLLIGYACRNSLLSPPRFSLAWCLACVSVFFLSAVAIEYGHIDKNGLWVVRTLASVSGAFWVIFLSRALQRDRLLSALGRDSLVLYAVNALSLNIVKLLFFTVLSVDARNWSTFGQLLMGLFATSCAMALMVALNSIVQRRFPWAIGKQRSRRDDDQRSLDRPVS
jgi:hypothetical protein